MKKPVGRPSKWPYEFRKMIVERVLAKTQTYRELAQEFDIPHPVITRWKRHYLAGTLDTLNEPRIETDPTDVRVMNLEKENRALKEQLGDLYLQIQLLKKATAWVQRTRKESSLILTSESLDQSDEDVKC